MKKTHALIVLDGWGLSSKAYGNAIKAAKTPNFDKIKKEYPYTSLDCSGQAVGLYKNQMGNSEVGHLNLGAGRIVVQDSKNISDQIAQGVFFKNKVLKSAFKTKAALHLIGLISTGGVHSQLEHIFALVDMAKLSGTKEVYLHLFTDGRDTALKDSLIFVKLLQKQLKASGVGKIASLVGRYYGMDRDGNFDRTKLAYDMLVASKGQIFAKTATEGIKKAHSENFTDEFLPPIIIEEKGIPVARIKEGDTLLFFNFRADRMRQLVSVFCKEDFKKFDFNPIKKLKLFSLTEYDKDFKEVKVVFKRKPPLNTVGEVLAKANKTQLRISETTKYAHVTYFFNGGIEKPHAKEDRILIPSKNVKTFDLSPKMSAPEIVQKIKEVVTPGAYDFVLINFANCDMVGHTGNFEATLQATQAVDRALGEVLEHFKKIKASVMVTADHGNAEEMLNSKGEAHTAHTLNKVPFILVDEGYLGCKLRQDGKLSDIGPTLLFVMGIKPPKEFSATNLIIN